MTTSTDGSTSPDSTSIPESVNRVKEIVKHPEEDQLSPENFRVDQSMLDEPVVKTILTSVPIRKPYAQEFIRVHPDPDYREGPVFFINLKQNSEFYLVNPELKHELRPREYWVGHVFLATNRLGKPFLWIVTAQSPTGRISDWYTSAIECAEQAMKQWIQVVADRDAGVYTVALAEDQLEDPEWPEQTFRELFRIGFKRRTVNSLDHPVFKQLRGRA
jgi:hypothetical protein